MSQHSKKGRFGFPVGGSSNTHTQCPIWAIDMRFRELWNSPKARFHYENKPIQIYWKIYLQKTENFQIKISDICHISAQNIDCGYSLEPPRRGGSNVYPQCIFLSRNKKNNVYPC